MISGAILIAMGAIAIAFSLLEIASVFVQSAHVVWSLARKLSGRSLAPMSQMEAAMFWMQVFGLLIGGVVFVFAGLSVWNS